MKTTLLAFSLLALAMSSACDRRDNPENSPTPDAAIADTAPLPASDPTAPVEENADGTPIAATPANDDALAWGCGGSRRPRDPGGAAGQVEEGLGRGHGLRQHDGKAAHRKPGGDQVIGRAG